MWQVEERAHVDCTTKLVDDTDKWSWVSGEPWETEHTSMQGQRGPSSEGVGAFIYQPPLVTVRRALQERVNSASFMGQVGHVDSRRWESLLAKSQMFAIRSQAKMHISEKTWRGQQHVNGDFEYVIGSVCLDFQGHVPVEIHIWELSIFWQVF